jgi:ADP-ribose pyrophosphatase
VLRNEQRKGQSSFVAFYSALSTFFMLQPWTLLFSKIIQTCRVFSMREATYRSPRTGKEHNFYLIEAPDWVNIIALTAEDQVVLVKQYRFGTRDFCLEIPGGMLETEDSPEAAARRELAEETGYEGDPPVLLGVVHPNPAIQTNRCHTFLIRNAVRKHSPKMDATEDIEVQLMPLKKIPRLVADGKITHALVIAAFYWFFSTIGLKDCKR